MKRIVLFAPDLRTLEACGINKSYERFKEIREKLGKKPGESVFVGEYAQLVKTSEATIIDVIASRK
jgi:hypothetical protein